ncbi:MAG: GNAT family N-acetyltransferase [Bosea sp. (in: a-proteobacteria)]
MPLIRSATRTDLARIHEVRHGTAENRLSDPSKVTNDEVLWYLDHAVFLVSEDAAGSVQGFGCANPQTGYVWALFVIDGQHRQGHGKALQDEMLASLAASGNRQAFLTTGAGTSAEQFYFSQGWRDVGRTLSGEIVFRIAL